MTKVTVDAIIAKKDDELKNLKKATFKDYENINRLINGWVRMVNDSKEVDFETYLELSAVCYKLISDINMVSSLHNKLLKEKEKENEGAHWAPSLKYIFFIFI